MSTFTPNEEQAAAIAAFASFLQSDDPYFILSGPAGTGKTALLRHIRDSADVERMRHILGGDLTQYEWLFTATTNKAAEVLGRSMGDQVSTVHSALGLRVKNNFETGGTTIKKASNTIIEKKILVVDEASMVDPQLLRHMDEGTFQCKTVFVGDHCQLAPVGFSSSPAFALTEQVNLTEIMRSKDQPALSILNVAMRGGVDRGEFVDIPHIPGVIDYLSEEDAMKEMYHHFIAQETDSKIVAFTNDMVNAMNAWIRTERNLPAHPMSGETWISNNVTKSWTSRESTFVEQELLIHEVSFIEKLGLRKLGLDLELPVFELRTNYGTYMQPAEPEKVKELIKIAERNKRWDIKFALKENLADFRPTYASTVYKAQGSTYDTAFIHLSDIGRCRVPSQVLRMLYVACSRARKRICLIGNLPDKFKGNVNAPA